VDIWPEDDAGLGAAGDPGRLLGLYRLDRRRADRPQPGSGEVGHRPKTEERKAQPWTLAQVDAMAAALPARYAVLPYLGAGAGARQGEMFGLAVDDIDILRKVIHVRRQVRLIGDVPCFAPGCW
jgi:integrase